MRLFLCLLSLVPLVTANRTACFAYVDCFERAQVQLKDCVGGTAVALTVESKDQTWTAADLVKANGLVFNQCQDRLYREIVDFDTLQLLVQEDSRECFEKLPGSGKRIIFNPTSCVYSPLPIRDSYGKDTPQCVTEYYDDRQRCEQLLECCPDHLRCAERMNAVSVAYQHAKAKSIQIVSNMLKCVSSTEPTTTGTTALIENQRSSVRNAGLPFFRPEVATEERITRRLGLTSIATLEQRRQRFNRRYNQVRALLSQRIHQISADTSRTITPLPTTQIPSERRIAIIRNLLKNADDQELAHYVSLIADGNFEKLSALEREKMNKMDNEEQVDQAMQKMSKIRDAIKAALATKEQKTLNFLETSASTNDKLATVSENEWNSDFPLIGKVMSEIDSDTLVRAKKFANALGEALQAQKELLLATKEIEKAKDEKKIKEKEEVHEEEHKEEEKKPEPSMFHGSLPSQRTATKADGDDDREPHDFNQLTHNLRRGALNDAETTTEATTEATEQETTEATTTTESATEPAPAAVKEMPAMVRPLSQSKMVSIVQPHNGALETVKATEDAPGAEVLEQLEAEIEKKSHKEPKEEEAGEIKGEDKRAVNDEVKQEKEEEKDSHQEASEKDVEVDKEVPTTEEPTTVADEPTTKTTKATTKKKVKATSPKVITTTEEETTPAATEESTTSATEEVTIANEEATTTAEETTTTELPITSAPLNEKSKKLMKKIMKDMKKKIEKMRKKIKQLVATTTTKAPTTTTSPEDRPSLDVEPLTEIVEGSGLEVTTNEAETTTEVTATQKAVPSQQGVNYCAFFANCDDMVRDYHEQCDKRFSPEVINHGIDDAEIVTVLRNATISNNEIVLRACLRPLDKASYANLKQLLAIQRGVRRACLELGRNKNVLAEEQLATCNAPLPSTEALDDFLSKTHTRSEETHTLCLAKLAPLQDTCQAVSSCCASINACDNYIASSPVRQLREEAQGVLIKRQHSCEERMLDTLKYIQKRLTTRRRRV